MTASDPSAPRGWLLLVGAACVMYVADICSTVDAQALVLTANDQTQLNQARIDLFEVRSDRATIPLLLLGGVLVASALLAEMAT